MATKKQKRAAAEEKRRIFDAEAKASGLAAQKQSQIVTEAKRAALAEEAKKINERHRSILVKGGIDPDTGEKLKGRRGQRPNLVVVDETQQVKKFSEALMVGGFFDGSDVGS